MKFVFVLPLMLCYSSAQSADSSEYIVQSNLWVTTFRKRPSKQKNQDFPSESLTVGTSSKRPPPVIATATTLFGSDGLMISIGFNLL